MERQTHRQVPRQHRPTRSRTAATDEDGELALAANASSESRDARRRSRCACAREGSPPTWRPTRERGRRRAAATCRCTRCRAAPSNARRSRCRGSIRNAGLKYVAFSGFGYASCVHGNTWPSTDEQREQQEDERHRQEGDVRLHEPNDGARPARRRDALHGDERDAGAATAPRRTASSRGTRATRDRAPR